MDILLRRRNASKKYYASLSQEEKAARYQKQKVNRAEYRRIHEKEMRQHQAEYRKKNKEKIRESDKKYQSNHKEEIKTRAKKYLNKYREKSIAKCKRWHALIKQQIFEHYGMQCACCGEKQMDFLTIDHINGGGTKHLKSIGRGFYSWLKKNNFPSGFQTLCYNCNCGKRINHGVCPHLELEKQNENN